MIHGGMGSSSPSASNRADLRDLPMCRPVTTAHQAPTHTTVQHEHRCNALGGTTPETVNHHPPKKQMHHDPSNTCTSLAADSALFVRSLLIDVVHVPISALHRLAHSMHAGDYFTCSFTAPLGTDATCEVLQRMPPTYKH